MKENIGLANDSLNKWCGTKGINYYEGIEALGFLFKYAVPKLTRYQIWSNVKLDNNGNRIVQGDHEASVFVNSKYGHGQNTDPAQALFQAIREIITNV